MRYLRRLKTVLLIVTLMLTSIAPAMKAENPVIAIISSLQAKPYQQAINSFQTSLRRKRAEIKFIHSDAENADNTIPAAALIFALGSRAVRESLKEAGEHPLLATMILNNKILQNTSHSTAVLLRTSILKQLQWHSRILPGAKRIGILYDPRYNQNWVDSAADIAARLGLKIIAIPVTSVKKLPSALKLLGRNADSLLGIADKTVYSSKTAKAILLYSFRNRIPFVGLSKAWVKAGALYALDWDYSDLGSQCAAIALRLLDGEKAETIQAQLPDKQIYLFNLKTAKQMKLEISKDLIAGAFKVYK